MRNDAHGIDLGQSGSHQQLRAVRNQPLNAAGEGIEDAGRLAPVHTVPVADLPCYAAHGEDGHRVVRRADVHQTHEEGNGQFCPLLAVDVACDDADEIVDAAVLTDDFQHSACHHRDDDQFAHARDACAHAREPAKDIVSAVDDTDGACQDKPDGQYRHHVHAEDGTEEDGHVRDDFVNADRCRLPRRMQVFAHEDIDKEDEDGRRCGDEEVDLELVGHLALLRPCGDDRRVTDEREIIAEERPACHHCHDERQRTACRGGDAGSDGRQGDDGPDTRPDADGNEAGSKEKPRQQQVARQDRQRQVDGSVDAAHLLGRVGKGSGKHEYPEHHHHVVRTGPLAVDFYALRERIASGDGNGEDAGDHECHGNRHLVEIAGHDGRDQIEHDEYE